MYNNKWFNKQMILKKTNLYLPRNYHILYPLHNATLSKRITAFFGPSPSPNFKWNKNILFHITKVTSKCFKGRLPIKQWISSRNWNKCRFFWNIFFYFIMEIEQKICVWSPSKFCVYLHCLLGVHRCLSLQICSRY